SAGAERGPKPAKQSRVGAWSSRAWAGVIAGCAGTGGGVAVTAPRERDGGWVVRDTVAEGTGPDGAGAGAATTDGGGAGAASATTGTATAAAARSAPAGSARRVGARRNVARRSGASTYRKVSAASPSESATAPRRAATGASGAGRSPSAGCAQI